MYALPASYEGRQIFRGCILDTGLHSSYSFDMDFFGGAARPISRFTCSTTGFGNNRWIACSVVNFATGF